MKQDLLLVAPELLLTVQGILLMLAAAWFGDRAAKAITWVAIAGLIAAAVVTPVSAMGVDAVAFGGLVTSDVFAAYSRFLIYIAAGIALIAAAGWFGRAGDYRAEYPVLVLFSCVGMGMMASASDLLTLYVGLEMMSLASYVLASFQRTDSRSAEAGLKYFVLGALASGLLLYGISLLYGFTGSTTFPDIAAALAGEAGQHYPTGQLFGIVFVLAGLAFKVSAVPFHMWTPDVYEGAPTPVTAFFASAPKVAAMVLLARVAVDALEPAYEAWRQIIIFMALASTILGGIAAINQTNIKRLLAYSSINNVGFALVGLAAGGTAGISAVLFYMTVYIVMTLGSFLIVLKLRDANGQPVESIASFAGLSKTRPGLALGISVFMFSLAGIPPLFGFWPKFVVFDAAVQANLTWLAAVAIATSTISAFYYLKIVKIMYFDEVQDGLEPDREPVGAGLIFLCALAVSPLGYLAIPRLEALTTAAAASLFA